MSNRNNDLVKQLEQIHQPMHGPMSGGALPLMLMGKDGTPFTVPGFSKGCFFKSNFFTLLSVNVQHHCAILEVLMPCRSGCRLFRTQAKVLVDLNCFCGVDRVTAPVFDYLQCSHVTQERICLPFMLKEDEPPKTIYSMEQKSVQDAETIAVRNTSRDSCVKMNIYAHGETIPFIVPRAGFRSLTVSNLKSIEILTPGETVTGLVDLQLNIYGKKKIRY